ncbi:hypothetical protein BDV26DRAFT_284128 [Aspergillus bertholletiae]|uniref:HNH nuclease domain-containing protein n=1 Tax=Aspergillus bertholletiae TaxID=1226010 RepID=A0A5N7AXL8_9EURO|nr:hypothetical protein BDV26DRAFT_284128 [Aspergillus bertholletiae]
MSPSLWAVLMLSDLSMLEKFVIEAEKSPYLMKFCEHACTAIPLVWKQKEPIPRQGSQSTSSKSSGANRKEALADKARERDGKRCVIRKLIEAVQVAHIYPWCLISERRTNVNRTFPPFWEMLRYFWSPEKIDVWHQHIFTNPDRPSTSYDSISNMICLSADLHQSWTNGRFALRPLEYNADKTELKFQLFHQPAPRHSLDDRIPLCTTPGSSRGLSAVCADNQEVYFHILIENNGQLEKVHSGQEFLIKTLDPVGLPLPSKELLEMAWILARVVNMSGAGGEEDIEGFSSESGYDIGMTAESSDHSEWDNDTTRITSAGPSPIKTRDTATETTNASEQPTLTNEI